MFWKCQWKLRRNFSLIPSIHRKLKTLYDVGLGYITLGQQATTFLEVEKHNVKLAEELSKGYRQYDVYFG